MTDKYSYLKFIRFKDVTQWYVGYYLNDTSIRSSYPLIPLKGIISPKRTIIKKENYDGMMPIVEKIVFKTGEIVFRDEKKTGMNLCSLTQNDLLVSSINFHQGATALNTFGDIVASTHYQSYLINLDLVIPQYLTMVLRSPYFLSIVSGKKADGIKNESGYSFIGSFCIPVPAISVQKSIVKAYNDSVLYANSLEHKAKQLEKSIDEYILLELGINDSAHSWSAVPNPGIEDNYLFFVRFKDIDRWDCYNSKAIGGSSRFPSVKLSQITKSKPMYGAGYKSKEYDGKIRYIRITDINDDGSLNDEKVSAERYHNRYLLNENDFLIARSGNTVGKSFLYKERMGESIYAGYLIRFELNTNKVLPEYLLYFTKCSAYKKWIIGNMRVSAQPNINSQQFLDSPIVLPPISIQNKIVNKISEQKEHIKLLKLQAEYYRKKALDDFEKEVF